MSFDTDVLVVGGGILGCCVAYFLARDGVDVVVIDRHDLNHQASGSNAGSLHVQMESARANRTDPAYVAAIDRSLFVFAEGVKAWQRLAPELDRDVELRIRQGRLVISSDPAGREMDCAVLSDGRFACDLGIGELGDAHDGSRTLRLGEAATLRRVE